MTDHNLKTLLTWRDLLTRAALVLVTVCAIVWFMPRDNRANFKIETGRPWRYGDMTATFDFPVYKSEATIKAQQDSALKTFEPYYALNIDVAGEQKRAFLQDVAKVTPRLSEDFKVIVVNRLQRLYDQGIVDNMAPLNGGKDSTATLRVVSGNTATSVSVKGIHTLRQAYELLMTELCEYTAREKLTALGLNEYLVPNLLYDSDRSRVAREDLIASVPKASGICQQGQKIVSRGEIVTERTALVLESFQQESLRRNQSHSALTTTLLGEAIYVLLFVTLFTFYLGLFRNDYFQQSRSLAMMYSLVVVFSVMSSILVSHTMFHIYLIPFAIVPIFVRVFMDARTAFIAHCVTLLICACMLQRPLEFIAVEMAAGTAAILSLRDLSSRSQLFRTALVATAAAMVVNLALSLIRTESFATLDASEFNYLLVSGVVLFCCYPLLLLVENIFGFTSDITLIELSDMNKELLRDMSEQAPGTFQHSIQVSNLAAEIARKLGAKAQLVRTGALYHDIGKTVAPINFTENQAGGISPHDKMTAIESAQTIISHVTEGLKLAEKHHLPQVIRDFIATHHGQGKARYFYVKYKNAHPDEEIDEQPFTYPGPNPFTKEQAILMMADGVEAASRSLPDYTEQSIRTMVNKMLDTMVSEGYFRECPITFRDIAYAKTVLIEKLKTIYHTRISYPEEKK